MRPDWDEYFFSIAALVASRATCPRARIGSVLVKQKRVIGTGYNGVPEGRPHCPDTPEHLGLDHCPDAVHAEYNALANALVPAFGATLYVVGPRRICPDCADRLRENGVKDIRWRQGVATLDALAGDIWAWARPTFPRATAASCAKHLLKEAAELDAAPTSAEEMADVFHLLAGIAGVTGTDLAEAVERKLAINRRRVWAEPDAAGVVEHVRDGAR